MKSINKYLSPFAPFLLGLGCLALAQILSYFPEFTEEYYRNGLFAIFRWVRDGLFSLVPIPLMLVILLLGLFLLFRGWARKRIFMQRPWWRTLLNTIGMLLTWFYISWGWNYSAPGLMDKLNAEVKALDQETYEALRTESLARASLHRAISDTTYFHTKDIPAGDVTSIHSAVREYLNTVDVETPGNVAMRRISKSGWMRKIGVAGIYMPFSGEGHADASYLGLREWFILAHEYAHGYGITDEGECNYIAFMSLTESGVHHFQYAAWLELAEHLLPHVADTTATLEVAPEIQRDRNILFEDAMRYRSGMQSIALASNNLYLLSQGVKEGVASYDLLPEMVVAARNREER